MEAPLHVATFLPVLAKDANRIYIIIDVIEADRKDFEKMYNDLESHFEPLRNVLSKRFVFNSTNQDSNMSIDEYVKYKY